MEPLWILVGMGAFALGLYLGHHRSDAAKGSETRDALPSREDYEMLRLHIDDAADKMNHLYDRIRKRYLSDASAGTKEAPTATLDGNRTPKDLLRARAASLGLWPRGKVE